jgi:hypothetical protein
MMKDLDTAQVIVLIRNARRRLVASLAEEMLVVEAYPHVEGESRVRRKRE